MHNQTSITESLGQHIPFLRRVVCRFMHGHEMADDIVQETMLRAATNAHKFRFESSLKTWLTSIAINEARQAYRGSWHKRSVPLASEDINLTSSQFDFISMVRLFERYLPNEGARRSGTNGRFTSSSGISLRYRVV